MKYFGWAGTILRINLANKKIKKQRLQKNLAMNFIGGRGFNSKILYDEVPRGIDPLSPNNKLIFGTGPCTGTPVPCSGRWTATAKSPVTDAFGDANAGGHWPAELKWAGYDCIIFESAARKPMYLWICDSHVELKDAGHLWGLDFWETTEAIRKELGDDEIKVAGIGPAGEKLVNPSCIMCDYTRAAGKCGMGAVMGSKKLKAVAVRGNIGIKVAKPNGLLKTVEESIEILKNEDRWFFENFSKYGTPMFIDQYQYLGALPTYNWSEAWFERADELSVEVFYEKYVKKKRGCSACVYHCSPYFVIEEGPHAGTWGEGTEYESIGGFGSKLGNSNLESTLVASSLCDKFGLDYIGASETLAWAMECYNHGILTKDDTDGLDLSWGSHEAILEAIRRMAYREGKFGDLLALGSRKAAQKVGKGSEYYSITIKGQQMGMMDPRVLHAWGFAYAVATRGGDHLRSHAVCEFMFTPEEMEKYIGTRKAADRFGYKGKGRLIAWTENIRAINDALENCKYFFRGSPKLYVEFPAKVLTAVTGLRWTYKRVVECGERICNIEKAFNVREGLDRRHDYLPERFYKEALRKGPTAGATYPKDKFNKILDEYYEARGWDKKTGLPTRGKLEEFGLSYIADELEQLGKLKQ